MQTRAYIGLGSNLGDRHGSIVQALSGIGALPGTCVLKVSAIQETQPLGPVQDQPMFLNAVAAVSTTLEPLELLDRLLAIEKGMGRIRGERWGPRIIDLDILRYGDQTINHPRLRVPHPEMMSRPFVLEGLRQVKDAMAEDKTRR